MLGRERWVLIRGGGEVGEKRGEGEYPHKANVKRDIHTPDRERLKRSGNT